MPSSLNALLEIMDDRWEASTVVVSQLPAEEWYARKEKAGDNTLADAILDRLMHTLTGCH